MASLDELPEPRILVDLDCGELKIDPTKRRCDFVLACDEHLIAPIELKSGDVELAQVAEQLTEGGRIADQWLPQDDSLQVRFHPIVVYRKKFNRHKRRKPTAREKVEFRGRLYEIKAIRSGSPLRKALSGD